MKKRYLVILLFAAAALVLWLSTGGESDDQSDRDEPPASSATEELTVEPEPDFDRRPTFFDEGEAAEGSDETRRPPGGTLSGLVFEPGGEPVEGAIVDLEGREGEVRRRLYTDADGHFEWNEAPAGEWSVVALTAGHDPTPSTPIRHDEEVALELTPGGIITGRVIDPDGRPVQTYDIGVANARLKTPGNPMARTPQLPIDQIDDDGGEFEFGPLQSGKYRLIVTTDDYAPVTTEPIDVSAGVEAGPVTVSLEGGSTMRGTVSDADTGEPIEGARVVFMVRRPQGQPPTDITDDRGHFELAQIPSGRGSIRVVHDDYVSEIFSGIEVPRERALERDVAIDPIGEDGPGQHINDIGATLRPVDNAYVIIALIDGAPAAEAGLRRGDVVTAIDGRSTAEMTPDQVIESTRGEPGTSLRLDTFLQESGTRTMELQRERIFVPRNPEQRAQTQ